MVGAFQAGQLLQSGQDSRIQFAHQPRIAISKFIADVKGGCTGIFFNNFTLCDMQITKKDSEQKIYLVKKAHHISKLIDSSLPPCTQWSLLAGLKYTAWELSNDEITKKSSASPSPLKLKDSMSGKKFIIRSNLDPLWPDYTKEESYGKSLFG